MKVKMTRIKEKQDFEKRMERCRALTILRNRKVKDRRKMKEKEIQLRIAKKKKIADINDR